MSKSSKYIGVSWNKASKKWYASARIRDKRYFIGSFDEEIEAHKAYETFIRSRNQNRIYTDRDKKYIKNNYMNLTDEQISSYLNRTPAAIKMARERLGLYKDDNVNVIKHRPHLVHVSKWIEVAALRNYIELGKGGQIAKDRLTELLKTVIEKPRIHKSKRKTALSEIAEVYEMYISGFTRSEIAEKQGHRLPTVCGWIESIQGYKGRNKALMVLDSRINLD